MSRHPVPMYLGVAVLSLATMSLTSHAATLDLLDSRWRLGDLDSTEGQEILDASVVNAHLTWLFHASFLV